MENLWLFLVERHKKIGNINIALILTHSRNKNSSKLIHLIVLQISHL